MKKLQFSLFLFFGIFSLVLAQEKSAISALQLLKSDGTLIVLIPSSQKKIAVLEKILAHKKISEKEFERSSIILAQTNYEQQLLLKEIITAFEDFYTFSELVFTYDFEFKKVLKGSKKISLLRRDGSFYSIDLPKRFLYCHLGKTDPSASTNISAWMMKFSDGSLIPKPFPNPISTNPMMGAIRGIFDAPEDAYRKNAIELAQTFQKTIAGFDQKN